MSTKSLKRKKMMPPPPPPPLVADSEAKKSEEGDVCAICFLQPYEHSPYVNEEEPCSSSKGTALRAANGLDLQSLGCGHVFHELCLDNWFAEARRKNKNAPLHCVLCDYRVKYPRDRVRLFFAFKKPVAVTPDEDNPGDPCNRFECAKVLVKAREVDALKAQLAAVEEANRALEQENMTLKAAALRNQRPEPRVSQAAQGGEEESERDWNIRVWREFFDHVTVMDDGRIVVHEELLCRYSITL